MSTAFKFPAEGFNINGGTTATAITNASIGGGGSGSVTNTALVDVSSQEIVSISGANSIVGVYEQDLAQEASPRFTIPNTDYVAAATATLNLDAKWASNRSSSVTGSASANAYQAYNINAEVKYVFSHITAVIPDSITIENYHNSGADTNLGVKNVLVYGSNAATFPTTTYADDTDLTLLTTILVDEHSASDVAEPQTFSITTSTAYKHYVLKLVDNHGGGFYIGFRKVYVSGQYVENYPSTPSQYTTKASNYLIYGYPWEATDRTKSLIGEYATNSGWITDAGWSTNMKFNVSYDDPIVGVGLYLENNHHAGAIVDVGVKNCILYGSNEVGDLADITYANVNPTMTQLLSFEGTQHILQNSSSPQYLFFTNTVAYKYYILRITNNWTNTRTGIRRFSILTNKVSAGGPCRLLSNTTDYTVSKATVSSTDYTITKVKPGTSKLSVSYIPSV